METSLSMGNKGETDLGIGDLFRYMGDVLYDLYMQEMLGEELTHLGHEGMTRCTRQGSPASDSLTKRTKRVFNSGLPDRALGIAGPSIMHDLVKVGVVPLSLHRLLYCIEGTSVFRLGHEQD